MKVSEEKKKKILELQLSGFGAVKVSKIISIPKTTVSNHMRYNVTFGLAPKKIVNKLQEKDCVNCGSKTFNPKFCCINCAAIYNNKHHIKRKKTIHSCVNCNIVLKRKKKTGKCKKCHEPKDMTLKEVSVKYGYGHRASIYSLVRSRARTVVKDIINVCANCGYSKHVEVCHIKSIASYSLDTKISEVNNRNNLIKLCPNCHWESEHGLLDISKIRKPY